MAAAALAGPAAERCADALLKRRGRAAAREIELRRRKLHHEPYRACNCQGGPPSPIKQAAAPAPPVNLRPLQRVAGNDRLSALAKTLCHTPESRRANPCSRTGSALGACSGFP
jgi:hypothetical protein